MASNKKEKNNISEVLSELDRVIHSPARLMIMTYLYIVEAGDAVYLMNQTGLSWGNLSTHLSKLEEAGYVSINKTFINKKPKTVIELTDSGRKAFIEYKSKMKEFIGLTD